MPKIEYRGYTDHLNRRPAENICHAFDFAKFIGRPLNNYVVMNFDAAAPQYGGTIFRKVVHKFRDWFNRRTKQLFGAALSPVFVYSLENPAGQVHVNWVVNIPSAMQAEFEKKHEQWLKKAQGSIRRYDVAAVEVDPHTDKSLAKYIIKGIDGLYVGYMHVEEYAAPKVASGAVEPVQAHPLAAAHAARSISSPDVTGIYGRSERPTTAIAQRWHNGCGAVPMRHAKVNAAQVRLCASCAPACESSVGSLWKTQDVAVNETGISRQR